MLNKFSRRDFLKLAGISSAMLLPPVNKISAGLGTRQWIVTGHDVPELTAFDNNMKTFIQDRNISGGALAVTRNGKLALARGYTYSDDPEDITAQPTSLFRIASISKPITATSIMRLVQDGQLQLSDKLTDILTLTPPAGGTPDPRLDDITILNLLQHLGGWDRGLTFDPMFYDLEISQALGISLPITPANIITYMTGQPLQHTPGETYVYSNYGYCLLGRVIEEISGKSYDSYVQEKVFAPLDVKRPRLGRSLPLFRQPGEVKYHSMYNGTTVFDASGVQVPEPYGAFNLENMDSHGGWLTSAVGLARLAATFDDPANSPVLNQTSVDTMYALPENINPGDYTPGDWYYACGWAVRDWQNGYRNTWHDGSLPGTHALTVRRGDGLNWAVLFNQRDDPSGLGYGDIDGLLHNSADAVSTWPDHDFFDEYLTFHEIFLPIVIR